ncbi:MAG: 50S ribosomal protein L16 [Thermoplasmata archaeon]
MVRKPGRMYRRIEGQPYTRVEYMGGVPNVRISQFKVGNLTADFDCAVSLVALEACQIRDIAYEAARISATRVLETKVPNMFRLTVCKYPHNVLREHKMATGAGADRVSGGMRAAFGKAVGHAARVNIGDVILTVEVPKDKLDIAKEALRKANSKLPTPTKMVVEIKKKPEEKKEN